MLEVSAHYLDRLLGGMAAISLYLARLSGVVVLIIVGIVTVEVISRGVFGRSIGFSTEISGYALALCVSWPLAHVLHQRSHIRIDVIYSLASQAIRAILDIVALSVFGIVCYFLSESSIGIALLSYEQGDIANTTLGTPLWIPQALWSAGFIWFSLNVFAMLLRIIVGLVQKDFNDVQRLAGSGDGAVG